MVEISNVPVSILRNENGGPPDTELSCIQYALESGHTDELQQCNFELLRPIPPEQLEFFLIQDYVSGGPGNHFSLLKLDSFK